MVLNYIWIGFFLIAFVSGLVQWLLFGDLMVFSDMINSTFSMAKTAFEISLGLTGVLALWLGLMRIAEKAGLVAVLARGISPFFGKIFPEIPKGHPVYGSMVMNFAANMLGLDNAATPIGLKAMGELQELNPKKETASNAQIMFLVLNTSGLTIIPVSVMVYRAQMGAADPSDIFLPILFTTFCSTLVGLIVTSLFQRINLFQPVILISLLALSAFMAGVFFLFSLVPEDQKTLFSTIAANLILFGIMALFIGMGALKRINVYEAFVEGAKEGFSIAIKIIPYLVAILVSIGVFRASGAMDGLVDGFRFIVAALGSPTEWVDGLPTALMKPLSGSGARGLMIDAMNTHGADSFIGRLVSTFQGATDTTFYILAVYFGSVGIKHTRHAVTCGLLADLAGIIAAIFIAYFFF